MDEVRMSILVSVMRGQAEQAKMHIRTFANTTSEPFHKVSGINRNLRNIAALIEVGTKREIFNFKNV